MVQSKIVNSVNYIEHSKLNLADKGHSSCLYIVPILGKNYLIVLGKQVTHHAKEGVVYYPIYLLTDKHKIKAKIGVYEADVSIATSLIDDEGDVDLTQLKEPLLFSYVDTPYLDKYGTSGEDLSAKTMTPEEIMKEIEEDALDEEEEEEEKQKPEKMEEVDILPEDSDSDSDSEDDDVFTIAKKKETLPPEKIMLTFENVFTKEKNLPTLPTWTSETQEEAKIMRNEYKKSKSTEDSWYVKLLKNKNYTIHRNEGAGDCFFATIRDSFTQLGYLTTVQKLRAYLAQEVDEDIFQHYHAIYKEIEAETKILDNEMDKLEKTNVALKKQSDKTEKMEHQKDIVKEALHIKKEFNDKKVRKLGTADMIQEFGFIKNIQSVDDLRTYVQTSEFWADHWALNKMEILLKTKFIIIENTADPNQMLRCTEAHKEEFDPTYYILLAYYGNRHYELVSYKDKKIFKFGEIPFDIKKLVVDKCMEKSTGVFNRIPSFRQFQTELGIQLKPSDSSNSDDSTTANSAGLYDPLLVLSFHARSDQDKKPGMVPADNIPPAKRTEFSVLAGMKSWRRRLDDSWVGDGKTSAPFTTEDGNRWSSIDHYLIALRFKESNPAVYTDFTADANLGKDVKKAQSSIVKKKKDGDKDDGKYYDVWKKTSPLDETILAAYRKEALIAKFTQNLDMKELLKATGMAKLEHYVPRNPPFVDTALMEVRVLVSA